MDAIKCFLYLETFQGKSAGKATLSISPNLEIPHDYPLEVDLDCDFFDEKELELLLSDLKAGNIEGNFTITVREDEKIAISVILYHKCFGGLIIHALCWDAAKEDDMQYAVAICDTGDKETLEDLDLAEPRTVTRMFN